MCAVASNRMAKLTAPQAAIAWALLAHGLMDLADHDIPKFADLFRAIRVATIKAHHGTNHLS